MAGRTATGRAWASETYRGGLAFSLACLVMAVVLALTARWGLWDLEVLGRAIAALHDGRDPYGIEGRFRFVYPPVTTWVLGLVPPGHLWLIPALNATVLLLPLLVIRLQPVPADRYFQYLALLVVPFGAWGITAFESGNLTLALHALTLGAVLATCRRRDLPSLAAAALAIVLAAIFKPYYLALLMVLVFRRRIWGAALAAAGVGLTACLVLVLPDAASLDAWMGAMATQTKGFRADLGWSLLGLTGQGINALFGLDLGLRPFILAGFALNVALGLALLATLPPFRQMADGDRLAVTCAVAAFALIMNPRLQYYDTFLLPLLLFVCLRQLYGGGRPVWVAFALLLATFPLHYTKARMPVGMVLVQLSTYWVVWLVWRSQARPEAQAAAAPASK